MRLHSGIGYSSPIEYEARTPPPPGAVGPHGQLKALEQPVIPAADEDLAQVALERARLDPAEHRDARGPNVQGAAPAWSAVAARTPDFTKSSLHLERRF